MKMETVEHFARIALVTHVLRRQQPLGNHELEKLLLARNNRSDFVLRTPRGWAEYFHWMGRALSSTNYKFSAR